MILAQSKHLKILFIAHNYLDDKVGIPLAFNPTLAELDVSEQSTTDCTALAVQYHSSLEILRINGIELKNRGAISLTYNSMLKELNISCNDVTDEIIPHLVQNKKTKYCAYFN